MEKNHNCVPTTWLQVLVCDANQNHCIYAMLDHLDGQKCCLILSGLLISNLILPRPFRDLLKFSVLSFYIENVLLC